VIEALAPLLSEEGWAYASLPPQEPGDPGRFHALFGRDSLITALQVLPAAPEVARATLRTLAAKQGRRVDAETDEEPGKILHEWRTDPGAWFVDHAWPVFDGELLYYGTADATSWFLVLLRALGDADLTVELEPAWRAAGAWLDGALVAGGGLVRYGPRRAPGGLAQQGWRDASGPVAQHPDGGGILRPDGTDPRAPLADADCQAVAYAALRALAVLDPAAGWDRRAGEFGELVSREFGSGEVMAIEGDGAPVPGAGSQLGWLLWAGVLDATAAEAAADRLCEPDVLSPYGLRTLSSEHSAFHAHAYHRGAIWPFDSWLGWSGLRAQGREAAAAQVRDGVLEALERLGRGQELYAVTADGALEPVAFSNRMQAWTVGARWALEQEWSPRP
jgi:glycogen debranching enzyme